MTVTLPPELAGLPRPEIVEELGFEQRLALFVTRLRAFMEEIGVDYDVETLETDPAIVLMQVAAYVDVQLRQRINEAIRATLLPFATGADLDILAAFYDVTRLFQESDGALRRRVVLAVRGRSTGGTEPRYRSVALSADPRVTDAAVYTVGRDPTVRVAVFSSEAGGVASVGLVAKVDTALQAPSVRMVNDRIVVTPAVRRVVDVSARIWLLPTAPVSTLGGMETALRAAWAREAGLGFDLTRAWLTARLMMPGVQRVTITAPTDDVQTPFNEAIALGAVALTFEGRDY